jgi:hypothetical protein
MHTKRVWLNRTTRNACRTNWWCAQWLETLPIGRSKYLPHLYWVIRLKYNISYSIKVQYSLRLIIIFHISFSGCLKLIVYFSFLVKARESIVGYSILVVENKSDQTFIKLCLIFTCEINVLPGRNWYPYIKYCSKGLNL